MTFISMHSVIICVVFSSAYMRCTRLCSLNLSVTIPFTRQVASEWRQEKEDEEGGLLRDRFFVAIHLRLQRAVHYF